MIIVPDDLNDPMAVDLGVSYLPENFDVERVGADEDAVDADEDIAAQCW